MLGIVQYNDENENPQNITWVCGIMNGAGTPLENYVYLNKFVVSFST